MKHLERLEKAVTDCGWTITDIKDISYGVQLTAVKDGNKSNVRLYCNKKGKLTLDTSQIKNESFAQLLQTKFFLEDTTSEASEEGIYLAPPLIGSDEAGKGDYTGALTVCAVDADEDMYSKLLSIGVKDSKKLTDERMAKLAPQIKKICPFHSIVMIKNERFNEMYAISQNINTILAWAHSTAIKNVLEKTSCKRVLIDKFGNESRMEQLLKNRDLEIVQHSKGEANAAVAAASILARCRYMDNLRELSGIYGIQFVPGAGQTCDDRIKEFVEKYGYDELKKVVKLNFKNTEKL